MSVIVTDGVATIYRKFPSLPAAHMKVFFFFFFACFILFLRNLKICADSEQFPAKC